MTEFERWIQDLEARHLADLRFAEVSRALRALSSAYVERRGRLGRGAALSGAGKRAAFALFYGPRHYVLVREIVRALGATVVRAPLVDLGCGTGAAGAAWALACDRPPSLLGVDRHRWALEEAARTYRMFGLPARTRLGDVAAGPLPRAPAAVLAAFTVNELPDAGREALLAELVARRGEGGCGLIVEPVARAIAPWWNRWRERVVAAGGRADEWRFHLELPPIVVKLARAAGLDHREQTGRSLWLG